jgi:predicted nucleic acid-binding protein
MYWFYLFGNSSEKKEIALSLLNSNSIISTQVVNENVNVCLKKLKLPKQICFEHGRNLMSACSVVPINKSTIVIAFRVFDKYQFSYWDSLVVASALENGCDTLLSEDMQNGLVVEDQLTISNPFKLVK